MIMRRHRFHGYGSLKSTYSRGQTVRGGLISLRFARRDPGRPYRVAVVVSRKVSKSAVIRNRIRRRIYEAIRRQAASIAPGTDLIFTVYGEQLATMEAAKLQSLVAELLQKTAKP
ncbi:MAG TPA: ribonuclease P protein component [Candidatus Saccharimonadales bacterium]|jgi:ribonuclease P protein component|nr:ribonuclease P protein component [Candidatus Saccharimonadales bacterium]